MIRKIRIFLVLFALNCFLTNCATIIHGSRQNIIILSVPKVANLEIDGTSAGQTPYVARLTRRNTHSVKIQLDGYTPYEITLQRKLNGWFFGNIIFGGIIGIAVDVSTGAMFGLSPKDVYAELNAASTAFDKTNDGIYLAVVLKPDTGWAKIGQLEKADSGK